MSGKHFRKYFQKYHIILSFATVLLLIYACNTTKKVPKGEYLLVKNNFKYEDQKIFEDELPDFVAQKPNRKQLFFFPVQLWLYNAANPKHDSLLNEYMTYPSNMRNQRLRDSLFIKYGFKEDVGKNLTWDRFLHNFGQPPVILDKSRTETSANNIRKRLVYRGFWDAKVRFDHDLDSAAKKAEANYYITTKDQTFINGYYYDIPYPNIKKLYEEQLVGSLVRSNEVLDQTVLEREVRRINTLMRSKGYYQFNNSNEEISFTADTLNSRKNVPLTMKISKDTLGTPYKKSTFGKINVAVIERTSDFYKGRTEKDSLKSIYFHKLDQQFKNKALWRAVIVTPDSVYNQKHLDMTRRNILAMNNFSIIRARDSLRNNGDKSPNDSIIDVLYLLRPLDKFQVKVSTDVNFSQMFKWATSPSVDLTTRNLFGGAENLSTSVSLLLGRITNPKDIDKRIWASDLSFQANLTFPRLLLPLNYDKLIPKRYSPTTTINLGTSVQNNIGLGRFNVNAGMHYAANVNDIVSHRLSIFNTQFSLTRNKDSYYDFFTRDRDVRNELFEYYSPTLYQQFVNGQLTSDELSGMIISDQNFVNSLSQGWKDIYNTFFQSLINKDRQTQDVLISSFAYHFLYNEMGKKEFRNPFYFSGKMEVAGNLLSIIKPKTTEAGIIIGEQRTIFDIPYSQFVKFDFDVRKYFTIGNQTLALRQFIGIGIPYGNSSTMPFVRSYFNGGSNDIRAWNVFGGLGPADSQLDEKIRAYAMDNVKLTTNIEYRIPFNSMFEGAVFTDMGNIWSLKGNDFGDEFKFNKFYKQLGIGSGFGIRINVAYITLRLDLAYKIYDPNVPEGERWRFSKIKPLQPTWNFAFGYPF